jgi:uncharacterized protein
MTPLMIAALGLLMVATSFLSGLFGMAGGLILIGVLLALMPLPSAMVLHAITQMASNGWRAFLWRSHIRWRPVCVYLIGCAVALAAWSITRYVPDKPMALLLLGATPFMARLMPANLRPNPESIWQGTFYGSICMGLMLMTGVSGPLLDTFFLGGQLDRRGIVATKATCQVASHFVKLIYFGGIIDQAASLDPVLAGVAVAARARSHDRSAVSYLGEPLDHHRRRLLYSLRRLAAAVAQPGYCLLLTERVAMAEPMDPLVLDLVEWIAREPRLYSEVIETWRTSCPRLTIWEDAVDRGYVARQPAAGTGTRVAITAAGETFLRAHGRAG